ncbi:hypothetical protein BP6252_11617 [Coleophoma cylindrospora]|uniref:Uncharacterized protein n=1 Tax=Coleophoma cylindrospora TaxID=1849047 RepID=A0A3D8QL44_9HELO|nr:hypothetical protein BP6252_11617 [Coleophoma cylindrospora]
MRLSLLLLLDLCCTPALCHGVQHVLQEASDFSSTRANANSIFNTVHSAMRQWGSSMNHNGMSLLPACIPQGTILYHGTRSPANVTGMEWLSFEIDHAELFAIGIVPSKSGANDEDDDPLLRPLLDPGWLHIFRTNRALDRLLYIDGMSAAKSPFGTLDSQDALLLNTTLDPLDDFVRAHRLCALGAEWGIEGFIRMEAGFEIVLCDFSDGLDLISRNKRPSARAAEGHNERFFLEYMRSVSERYFDIGASRVMLDFSSMVSAYFYPVNFSNPDSLSNHPRLVLTRPEELSFIRAELQHVLKRPRQFTGVHWQGVADLVVSRYQARLKFLAAGPPLSSFLSEVNHLLNVFVDYEAGSSMESSITQCASQYVQSITVSTPQDELLWDAITTVNRRICTALFEARGLLLGDGASSNGTIAATVLLQELTSWLDWSIWKRCPPCSHAEVCFIAMWPFGEPQDHFNPGCQDNVQMRKRHGWGSYWNNETDV